MLYFNCVNRDINISIGIIPEILDKPSHVIKLINDAKEIESSLGRFCE